MNSGIVAENLALMFKEAGATFGALPVFGTRVSNGEFECLSFEQLYERGIELATALIELGCEARGHVGLLSDNRVEWNIVDYGVILAGAADVPRGTDVSNREIEYIVDHSDAEIVFVENRKLLDRVITLMPSLPKVRILVLMNPKDEAPDGVRTLGELLELGKGLRGTGDRRVEGRIEGIKGSDLFTLIYTSGTTGTPKGVQLMHSNMISQLRHVPFDFSEKDRFLSILPVWHCYERVFQMIGISRGVCTYFTRVRTIADDLKAVKPTMMASAPRLWENLYLKILKSVDSGNAIKRGLFHAAYYCSRMVKGGVFFLKGMCLDLEGRSFARSFFMGVESVVKIVLFTAPFLILNAVVLRKLRDIVGGEFRGTVSGGGALPTHVDEFFNFIGVPVLEGYGMTETSPVIAVRNESKLVIGTVGELYEGVSLRIVDLSTNEILYPDSGRVGEGRGLRGEIHIKGPQVMKGYYKNEEATDRVLCDEWINTGDIGMYTFNDCLKLLGRSKDTIVLLNGENVEPIPIEARICQSPLIDQCMVVGQDQKHLCALVVSSLEGFGDRGMNYEDLSGLSESEECHRVVLDEVRLLVSGKHGYKAFEIIHDVRLLPKGFEIGDEMTSTFKTKRHVVDEKYSELIARMY